MKKIYNEQMLLTFKEYEKNPHLVTQTNIFLANLMAFSIHGLTSAAGAHADLILYCLDLRRQLKEREENKEQLTFKE